MTDPEAGSTAGSPTPGWDLVPGEEPKAVPSTTDFPYDREKAQDDARRLITMVLLIVFLLAIAAAYAYVSWIGTWNEIKDWSLLVVPSLTSLLSVATGFYLGTRTT
ncbi:MAG TPA: hypothetical protein VIC35_10680 [Acidimicrobiia bacterium]|jgi:hypothetical protein